MILLNPKQHDRFHPDERSREIMHKTIAFFENKGLKKVKAAADAQPGLVRGVSMAGELIAILDLATGEDGSPEWQPKKVFFS